MCRKKRQEKGQKRENPRKLESLHRQKIAPASTPAAAGTGQGSEEEKMLLNIQRVLYIHLARRPDRDQALDMQAVMAAIAGYFGGYTSNNQPIGDARKRRHIQMKDAEEEKYPIQVIE